MDCDIIKDLLPLYIDECCSKSSANIIKEHLKTCPECRRVYDGMRRTCDIRPAEPPRTDLRRVDERKASVLQSLMLFVSFALITLGVTLESGTPAGAGNGTWALTLIVPATGYLLSLANLFFVRVYKSRKVFSFGSCLGAFVFMTLGYIWALLHYADSVTMVSPMLWLGVVLSMAACVISGVLADRYAVLLGRE